MYFQFLRWITKKNPAVNDTDILLRNHCPSHSVFAIVPQKHGPFKNEKVNKYLLSRIILLLAFPFQLCIYHRTHVNSRNIGYF